MRKKASFTLLEILLCAALVAFVLAGAALSVPRFLASERFEKQVRLVEEKLALVQELSIDCETKAHLVFDGNQLTIVTSGKLPQSWTRIRNTLHEIEGFSFEGEKSSHLELVYDGEMGSSPRGVLTLYGKKRSRTLSLPGFPGKIKRGKEALYAKNAPYPQELVSHP